MSSPYDATRSPNIYRRFIPTEDADLLDAAENIIARHQLTRKEVAIIVMALRVRPEFGPSDFGIELQRTQECL